MFKKSIITHVNFPVSTNLTPDPIRSQLNALHVVTPYFNFFEINFIVISPIPRSSKQTLPFRFCA
jgi:hypothetical protein